MVFNPAQFLKPQLWNQTMPGYAKQQIDVVPENTGANFLPELTGAPPETLAPNLEQLPFPEQSEPLRQEGKRYFKGIQVPLSQNNPYLAYMPKPGKGQIVTQKFVQDAINWENQEAERQQLEANRGQMAEIISQALQGATQNPNLDTYQDLLGMYGGLTDLIRLPGGEAIAGNIIKELRDMYMPRQPEAEDPLLGLKKDKIRAEIAELRRKAAEAGLKGADSDRKERLKAYNDAYDRYARVNGAKWNPYANDGEGGWEFPMGFKPLSQMDFIRKEFGKKAADDYYESLTGMKVSQKPRTFKTTFTPKRGAKAGYSKTDFENAQELVIKHNYTGPGDALKAVFYDPSVSAKTKAALFDWYNESVGDKYKSVRDFEKRFKKEIMLAQGAGAQRG